MLAAGLVKLFFSYSPPRASSPTTTDPPPSRGVDFESFSTRKRLKIDSKTTEKRLEIDSRGGGGSVVVGDEARGWAVAEKQFH